MGGERKERKLSPRLNMIWMRPVSLILSCIFLYFTQYNQGPLVSFLFSKNKVPFSAAPLHSCFSNIGL